MPPGPRPNSVPSGILIYPTVWPQHTNVDRQDNGPVALDKLLLVTGAQIAWSLYTRARRLYMDKIKWSRRSRNRKPLHTRRHLSRWTGGCHFWSRKTTSGRKTTTSGLTKTVKYCGLNLQSNNPKASVRQKSTPGDLRRRIFTCC